MATTLSPDGREHAELTAEAVAVEIDGRQLGEEWIGMLVEVQVRDTQFLPDMALIRFLDPTGEKLSSSPLKLGSDVKVSVGAARDPNPTILFTGEIVALEPEFRDDSVIIAARAFDKGHRLNRKRKSATFVQVKAEDIVRRIASQSTLTAGEIDSTGVTYDHIQQSQETDWELCTRLARTHGFEFGVWDDRVVFRKRKTGSAVITLTWQETLLAFRPRASAVGQVSEVTVKSRDPKAKQQTVGQARSVPAVTSAKIWDERTRAISALSGGDAAVADRVAISSEEAKAMADAALSRNASAFLEAEGLAHGSPKIAAGATVSIQGVGDYSGDYLIAATTHVYKGATGYVTRFEITGDRPRAFTELVKGGGSAKVGGASASSWGSSLVIALVTNNNDPDKLGRVKVKYPALGDNIESDWARVAVPNAGKERGFFFMPEAGDEVVVGFEHGDTRRPFILGSLYNAQSKPDADLLDPNSNRKSKFGVKTDHEFLAHAEKELKLHSNEKLTIEIKGKPGDALIDADGNVTATAKQNIEVSANSSVKIKGTGTVEIESSGQLKVKGATVSVEGSAMVEVKGGMVKLG